MRISLFFNECVIFIGCNFESRASQAGYHKKKKDTASAKEGKVSYCVEEDKDARLCSIIKRRPVACSLRGRRLKGKEKILSRLKLHSPPLSNARHAG